MFIRRPFLQMLVVGSLLASLVALAVLATGALTKESPTEPLVVSTPWPDPKPPGPGIPEALTWTKGEVEWGDERPLGAEAVGECPLDSDGCAAAEALLSRIRIGDYRGILAAIAPQGCGPLLPAKPGLQIDDASALSSALDNWRQHRITAIGCPQRNGLGPEPGACQNVFVLALDITQDGGEGNRALALVFVRKETAFSLSQVRIQPYFDLTHGGLSMTLSLPYDLTGGPSGLWYTPWLQ